MLVKKVMNLTILYRNRYDLSIGMIFHHGCLSPSTPTHYQLMPIPSCSGLEAGPQCTGKLSMTSFPSLCSHQLGGTVQRNQFYFSLIYEEGDEMEGGCLHRKSQGKFNPLPGYPGCFMASGVVNFFLARTHSIQSVGFDPKLKRVAHSGRSTVCIPSDGVSTLFPPGA